KTGEFWIADRMLGAQTRGDFEHCEVALFLGKNPWHSHSIPRARVTLKELARDPARALIVIDPRRTETAAMADLHLQVKPGGDAWLLTAMLAIIAREDLVDHAFLDARARGQDEVLAALREVPIAEYCARAGVDEALARAAARRIATAGSVASFEDLGVQMSRHSTLVSYLHRLLWLLTGNYGKPGTQYTPTTLVPFATGASGHRSPVAQAPIISGLVPCNMICEEILTDHPKRYRAMIVEAANPAHSLADSQRMREALRALDTVVVIDVAMSETARLADYVLPAATQFEKAEATFFNFEFPDNYFHLRRRLLTPPDGPLPEAEIHARLCEALGGFDDGDLAPLRAAAAQGLEAYGMTFMQRVLGDARLRGLAAVILYRTLGPTLPEGLAEGAVLLGLAFRCAMQHGEALARAGFGGPPPIAALSLFRAILESPSGVVFARGEWSDVRPGTRDGTIQLALPDMLAELRKLAEPTPEREPAFPFILAAGERRSFTANTIVRDPAWRKKDPEGALRVNPEDAARLGLIAGGRARVTTRRGSAVVTVELSDTMQPGHISLPNGLGTRDPEDAAAALGGVAPNELTAVEDRDPFAGTPWHKYVPARIEALA
ncbi:MAG: molybdopterin-dependent oxidoreductase, partial [Myxococcales bacterium]|nr:molybdopterin-dependent oxidoreductase [Myxococcales bacterium]